MTTSHITESGGWIHRHSLILLYSALNASHDALSKVVDNHWLRNIPHHALWNHESIVRLNVNDSEFLLCIFYFILLCTLCKKDLKSWCMILLHSFKFKTGSKPIFYKLGEISQKHSLFSNPECYKACFPVCSKMLMLRIWCFEDDFPVLL